MKTRLTVFLNSGPSAMWKGQADKHLILVFGTSWEQNTQQEWEGSLAETAINGEL